MPTTRSRRSSPPPPPSPAAQPDLRIAEVGDASLDVAIGDQVSSDFSRAEKLSLPITLVILLLTFGALIAAGVPLVLALSAVAAAIGLSALVSHVTPVTDTLNSVILLIGMAVGVDYSLFYVRRAREERDRGASRADAIEIAARTSGRAVVVSGLAVCIAMSGLLLSGDAIFASMAIGTMLVVAVAVLGSLTVLPAMLSLLGDRIDRPRIPLVHRLRRSDGAGRFWPAVMRVVLHKPLVSLLVAGLAMVALALPALGMRTGEAGADSLPRSIPIMNTYDDDDRRLPADRLRAHRGRLVARREAAGPRRPADRRRRLVAGAERSGRFASLDDVQPELAPDGRTATIDLPVTGDFNTDRSQQSLALVRERARADAGDSTCRAPRSRRPGPRRTRWTSGPRCAPTCRWVMAFVLGLTFVVLVRVVPVGRGGGHRRGAEPAVGRGGVRAAGAGLPARAGPGPARLPRQRHHRRLAAAVPVRGAVRAVDGLPRVRRQPDPRGPRDRDADPGRRGAGRDLVGGRGDQRGGRDGRGVQHLRDAVAAGVQAAGCRSRGGCAHRRDDRAGGAAARRR